MTTDDMSENENENQDESIASISLEPMDLLKTWPASVRLGQAILAELGFERGETILVRWMAHRIAELIEVAENDPDEASRDAAKVECSKLVLQLWSQRREWPDGAPFKKLIRALRGVGIDKRYMFSGQSDKPVDWLALAMRIHEIRTLEVQICMDAFSTQFDSGEVDEELQRTETVVGLLDEEEATLRKYLDRIKSTLEDSDIPKFESLEENTKYFKGELKKAGKRRDGLEEGVNSSPNNLDQLRSWLRQEPVEEDDSEDEEEDDD